MLAYIIAALGFPNIPHPVLALTGEQGTAKSMITKRIVQLVDPSSVLVRKPPRDPEAWVTAAQGSYVVGIDNLSSIPEWLSDSLCRAVTGDGDVRRQLYTDGGLAVFAFRRCIVFNGIDVGALRGDLADRTMHVSLERISKRIGEKELEKQWSKDYPGILGACIAGVACVLGGVSQVGKKEEELPRMADFARILATVDDLPSTEGLKAVHRAVGSDGCRHPDIRPLPSCSSRHERRVRGDSSRPALQADTGGCAEAPGRLAEERPCRHRPVEAERASAAESRLDRRRRP